MRSDDITSPARKRETPLSEIDSSSSYLKYPHTHLHTCKEVNYLICLPVFRVMRSSRKITVVLIRPAFILRTALATTSPSTFTLSSNRPSSSAYYLNLQRQLGSSQVKSKAISMLDAIALSTVRFSRRVLCDYITAKVLSGLSVLSSILIN
jgi:hypothetical protein